MSLKSESQKAARPEPGIGVGMKPDGRSLADTEVPFFCDSIDTEAIEWELAPVHVERIWSDVRVDSIVSLVSSFDRGMGPEDMRICR